MVLLRGTIKNNWPTSGHVEATLEAPENKLKFNSDVSMNPVLLRWEKSKHFMRHKALDRVNNDDADVVPQNNMKFQFSICLNF